MEFLPFLTHFVGALLLTGLAIRQIDSMGIWRPLWSIQFYVMATLTMANSALYHILPMGELKELFHYVDFMMIFILIASSFSAIHGVAFDGKLGWGAALLAWAVAIILIVIRTLYSETFPYWGWATVYLVMGWMGVLSFYKLMKVYEIKSLLPIMYGGIAYSVGYVHEISQIGIGIVDHHSIFHMWVLIGIACHWYFVSKVTDDVGHLTNRSD